jgi:Respiratory-chain NADH dehydrogenase 51 Kd subunit
VPQVDGIGNGAGSEPASRKDKQLLWTAPHLVLDGLQLAAEAVGTTRAYLYVHAGAERRDARPPAQIARYGASGFRAAGTPAEPGTMLATCWRADGPSSPATSYSQYLARRLNR